MDDTEALRRDLVARINETPNDRARLEAAHGQVWDSTELRRDFEALGFLAPFIHVRRRADGVCGTLLFQHEPRLYWGFQPDGR